MPTLITKNLGPGGDYTSATTALDDFFAAVPANLVTADQIWKAVFADGFIVTKTTSTVLSGKTTDSTRYIEITGVTAGSTAGGLTITGSGAALDIAQPDMRINKLKITSTNNTVGAQPSLYVRSSITNTDVNQCIIDGYGQNSSLRGVVVVNGSGNHVRNSLIIQRATDSTATICQFANASKATNVTAVSIGVTMASGVVGATVAATLKNVYIGNVTAAESGLAATKTTCASSAGGTGWSTVPFSTATFVNLTSDFKLATGSALIDAGTNDSTYSATDLLSVARPQGTSTDVGAYEYNTASPDGAAAGATLTGTGTIAGGAASGGAAGVAPGAAMTGTATISPGAATGGGSASGTLTTLPLKNNTGTVLASETGIILNIYNQNTGALIVQKTGVTTNSSGIATVTDALIVGGTTYAYEPVLTGGRRRLPLKAAT